MKDPDLVVGIGGAAGEGIASSGDTLALSLARQGLGVYAYNSHQSVIRGGHSWLRMRISTKKPLTHGDALHALVALNQDTMDRHLPEVEPGGLVLYNEIKINVKPGDAPDGVQLCPLPVGDLSEAYKTLPVMQNTVAVGALTALLGLEFQGIASILESTFAKKGEKVVGINVAAAKAGFDYARKNFQPLAIQLRPTDRKWAVASGNTMLAMGAAVAGCRFYCAYPMSPASGILHWMASYGPKLGICVRQIEDEIAVINATIGANHMGVRGMCATSGGGFALMTEAIGMAAMLETPVVAINVMRAGPSTGVPTKTEQADLNQVFGASQGDYERFIIAPVSIPDCYETMPLAFNLADHFQCPVLILSDLLMSEGTESVDPAILDVEPKIDRGELITQANGHSTSGDEQSYLRYLDTESGISPRAIPGLPGHLYVAATDDHDEDGVLISDVYTDTVIRKKMVEKRARKMSTALEHLPAPKLEGPAQADVTLVGWGSTWGVITEAVERLNAEGVATNHLQIKFLIPFQSEAVMAILDTAKSAGGKPSRVVIVENNHSGQFARHLRAETGFVAAAHIRKYDGEPFETKHIVAGVKDILAGADTLEGDDKNIVNVLSTEPGWRTEHPVVVPGAERVR